MEKISWFAPEYIHTRKTSDWYWIVGIITVSIALISIIMGNIIFAVLIIVASFTLTLYASRPPEEVEMIIDGSGVRIGNVKHLYSNLESFWVENEEHIPRAIIKSNRKITPHLVLLIEEVHPDDVRDVLSLYLPEVKQSEPFFEKLFLYLGF